MTDNDYKDKLSDEAFKVCRLAATERPFTGIYNDHWEVGDYYCACCDQALYSSTTKFNAGCGWPSFTKPIEPANVTEIQDRTLGMVRIEVRSHHGDSHLGHVFSDGPIDRGGLRYCINSASLRFVNLDDMKDEGYGDYIDQVEILI